MKERDKLFIKVANDIANVIKKNQDLSDDDTAQQFISNAEKQLEEMERIEREGRDLVVGVVGCVKAGKSTFLNALIFDGKQVLPKAATPMTAALTRIRFSKEPKAKIVFYQQSDWINILSKNDQYHQRIDEEYNKRCKEYKENEQAAHQMNYLQKAKGLLRENKLNKPTREDIESEMIAAGEISDELSSSHELVEMAKERISNVDKYLNQEKILSLEHGAHYLDELDDYVGADGKYTPIVNYIELEIDDPRLEGIEVVDTPGLNDPIVSRERKTINFLKECDVIFVVSSVSQFLVESDIHLIRKKLNEENIHRAYVIGTQLDSGILQYKSRNKSLREAMAGSINAYNKQAENVFSRINTQDAPDIIKRLAASKPTFVSAMMYSIAQKKLEKASLTPEEELIVRNLENRFRDFNSMMESVNDYFIFSGIGEVKEIFVRVREEKQETIQEEIEKYTTTQSAKLLRLLEIVNVSVRTRLNTLENADAEVLEKKLLQLSNKLDSIRWEISGIFQRQAKECDRIIQATKIEISHEISNHQDISVETRTEHRLDTVHTGLFGLMRKSVEWDEHIKEASSNQVINNVQQYSTEAQKMINENLQKLFDIDGLKKRIKECVIGAFDLASREFNESEILLPLEALLAGLTVQEVRFDFLEELERSVDAEFPSGKAEGNDIHKLNTLQTKLANRVLERIIELMDQQNQHISDSMNIQSSTFVDNIESKIAGNIDDLRMQLKNKQENIERYNHFIDEIRQCKQQLLEFQG